LAITLALTGTCTRILADEPTSASRLSPNLEDLFFANKSTAELLAYLDVELPTPVDIERVKNLIPQLGDPSQKKRDSATKELTEAGPVAYSLALAATTDRNPEIRLRAGSSLLPIARQESFRKWCYLPFIAKLLAQRGEREAMEPILRLLAWMNDDELQGQLWFALDILAKQLGVLDPKCRDYVNDSDAVRRAAAGFLLARYGNHGEKALAGKLLEDKEPAVRLRTAQGFLGARLTDGVPSLISLLQQESVFVAWEAEELLRWLAGEDAPVECLGEATAEARAKCVAAWKKWWGESHGGQEIWKTRRPARPGLYLVTDGDGTWSSVHREGIIGSDTSIRWFARAFLRRRVQQFLPGDHLLLAGWGEEKDEKQLRARKTLHIYEADLSANDCFDVRRPQAMGGEGGWPVVCVRLWQRFTFLADNYCIMLIDSSGKELWRLTNQESKSSAQSPLREILFPVELQHGCVVCRHYQFSGTRENRPLDGWLVDIWTGKKVREFDRPGPSIVRPTHYPTPDDHAIRLVATHERAICEVDSAGHELWRISVPQWWVNTVRPVFKLLALGFETQRIKLDR
jgi:HEAT repeat protein